MMQEMPGSTPLQLRRQRLARQAGREVGGVGHPAREDASAEQGVLLLAH